MHVDVGFHVSHFNYFFESRVQSTHCLPGRMHMSVRSNASYVCVCINIIPFYQLLKLLGIIIKFLFVICLLTFILKHVKGRKMHRLYFSSEHFNRLPVPEKDSKASPLPGFSKCKGITFPLLS